MKLKLLFLIFVIYSFKIKAQTSISGNVYNENQIPLAGVLVVNITTEAQTFTNENGYFLINASSGNELHFLRESYERISLKVNQNSPLKVELKYLPIDIETVILNYKPTGDLKEDIKHYADSKKDIKLNQDLGKYLHAYSSREVMKPKPGEFVQPKGPGFETTKIGFQWKKEVLQIYLEKTLTKNYFKSMGLKDSEIFSFIGFTLKNFDTKEILRFGRVNSSDLPRFQAEAERQIIKFKERNNK